MPAIKVDTPELTEILRQTPPEQNLMLIGRHGIGKSQIVTQFFRTQGERVVTFFLGQMSDPGDLIGLLYKDEKTGHSEFLPPYWWPLDGTSIVLFLDELNRARPEILQSVMDLTLNRTLAGKTLPPGSRVISAINEGDEYQLTDLDPALVSRFNLYEFSPTVEDWLVWANAHQVDPRVINFIQQNREYLDGDPKTATSETNKLAGELTRTPDRRSWERVSKTIASLEEVSNTHVKLLAGIVGTAAAVLFVKSVQNSQGVSADDVLLRFEITKRKLLKLATHDFAGLNERIVLRIQKGGFLPPAKKKVLENFHSYLQLLLEMKQSEACAHLASMLERPRFSSVSQFLMADAKILAVMVEFRPQPMRAMPNSVAASCVPSKGAISR